MFCWHCLVYVLLCETVLSVLIIVLLLDFAIFNLPSTLIIIFIQDGSASLRATPRCETFQTSWIHQTFCPVQKSLLLWAHYYGNMIPRKLSQADGSHPFPASRILIPIMFTYPYPSRWRHAAQPLQTTAKLPRSVATTRDGAGSALIHAGNPMASPALKGGFKSL